MRTRTSPALQALAAALLFGASAPFAKLLLGDMEPVLLAGLLYVGSGIGLLGFRLLRQRDQPSTTVEAPLSKGDVGWLAGAILAGGIAAPVVLLFSLRNTPAATASLLLNFEGVATTMLAVVAFKEAISRRVGCSIALVTLASIILSINPGGGWGMSLGALGIIAACILWGVDNNFTRNISAKDPLTIVTIKGLVAGTFSLGVALLLGNQLPAPGIVLRALLLGTLSYGASIVLFIRAMRGIGAARTSTLFAAAPFAGVLISLLLFSAPLDWLFLVALLLMIAGAGVLVGEKHEHLHVHRKTVHEHAHAHDDGHHEHKHDVAAGEAHSHVHQHDETRHEHGHMPDIHHRHEHGPAL